MPLGAGGTIKTDRHNTRHQRGPLSALWTDTDEFPYEFEGPLWWEVWLPVGIDRKETISNFRARVKAIGSEGPKLEESESHNFSDQPVRVVGMKVANEEIYFPERTVLLVHATVNQMQQSMTEA